MKIQLIIILICLWSCSNSSNCPNYGAIELDFIKKAYPTQINLDGFNVRPKKERGEIILFEGRDIWGETYYYLTFNCLNHDCNITSYFKQISGNQTIQSDFSEIILNQKEVDVIKSRIDQLECVPIDLDPHMTIIDGDYFRLFVTQKDVRAYEWQDSKIENENTRATAKEKAMVLVGILMNLADFPIGERIIIDNKIESKDSIEYDIFLHNRYRVRDMKVMFKNRIIKQDNFGIAKLKVTSADSLCIKDSVKLYLTLLDGQTAVL